jgi:toxin ParE1/3/4
MDYRIVFSPSARSDLRNIVRYISFDAPDEALQFGRFLISHTRVLAQCPKLGRVVPEFGDDLIREIIIRSYRIVYRFDDATRVIKVIRFWHAARGVPEIEPNNLA